jgi:universal stress protein A
MFEPQKILVPTDFSKYSDAALEKAIDLAGKYHSKIHLLHVIDKNVEQCAVDWCLPEESVQQLEVESFNNSKKRLQEEASKISSSNGVEVEFDIRRGVPYEEILKEQKEKGIDLIVISSHGRTGFMKYFMGGVAQKVLHRSESPVLLVR